MARLVLRVEFDDQRAIGPGKIRLLELIRETGSISAAGRGMGMSYRRAWLLVDALNRTFREPLVATRGGGAGGGGADLTIAGEAVIAEFRGIERTVKIAAAAELERLAALVRDD